MIPITKPFLPPIVEYQKLLAQIWERQWLTNNGPFVNELELKLKKYFSVPDVLYLNNGTIALQIAIKALELKGEIITTPFSFVATTSSIVWEGCTPVFVDIDEQSLNIDAEKIEEAITPKTTAIIATHVYGNPCNIDRIDAIAKKYNLKVIYDAAHCFGTKYRGKSVFSYGDISTTSYHTTKLFHTIEGGAVFSANQELITKMGFLRNFGHFGPENFTEVGVNGKNSEFHAAMGLLNLRYVEEILETREKLCAYYRIALKNEKIRYPQPNQNAVVNNAYFPIIFESEEITLKVIEELEGHRIAPRRYFYPSLNSVDIYKTEKSTPICDSISKRVLCLPLYHTLTMSEIDYISNVILRVLK